MFYGKLRILTWTFGNNTPFSDMVANFIVFRRINGIFDVYRSNDASLKKYDIRLFYSLN